MGMQACNKRWAALNSERSFSTRANATNPSRKVECDTSKSEDIGLLTCCMSSLQLSQPRIHKGEGFITGGIDVGAITMGSAASHLNENGKTLYPLLKFENALCTESSLLKHLFCFAVETGLSFAEAGLYDVFERLCRATMLYESVSALATNVYILTRLTRYISSFASSSRVLLSNDQCFVSFAFVFKNVTSSWVISESKASLVADKAAKIRQKFRRTGRAYLLQCIRPLTPHSRPSSQNRHAARLDVAALLEECKEVLQRLRAGIKLIVDPRLKHPAHIIRQAST
ncbi:hypothetical protein KC333_g52 [Hortaea werneckii]|nr:hypothetical protein KC333_g52 [Hortaea werneckii]